MILALIFVLFPYAGCSAFSPPAAVRTQSTSSSYFGGASSWSSSIGGSHGVVSMFIMRTRSIGTTLLYLHTPNSRLPHHTRRSNASPSRRLSIIKSTMNNQTSSSSSSSSSSLYKKRIAIIFAFLTGWVDYIFIKKYNYFATMHTGNAMKMASAIVNGQYHDTVFYLSIILSYMVGVGIFHRVQLSSSYNRDRGSSGGIIHGLVFAPIVATCFILSDHLLLPSAATASATTVATTKFCKFIPAILLSFAWGIINQIGNIVTGTLIFVVTGAMTRISTMIVD